MIKILVRIVIPICLALGLYFLVQRQMEDFVSSLSWTFYILVMIVGVALPFFIAYGIVKSKRQSSKN